MRVSFYTAALLPLFLGQQQHTSCVALASTLEIEAFNFLDAEAQPSVNIDSDTEAEIDVDCLNRMIVHQPFLVI